MNLVGKIFVGIIALLSVVCLTLSVVSYASHRNWKETAATLQTQIDAASKEKQDLAKQKSELEAKLIAEKNAYQLTIAALTTKNGELTAEISTIQTENAELNEKIDLYVAAFNQNNAVVGDFRKRIDFLTVQLSEAHQNRAAYLRDLMSAMTQLYETSSVLGDVQAQNDELTKSFDDALTVLQMHGLDSDPAGYAKLPKFAVDGTIEVIKEGSDGLLSVSIGSDDGLTPGNELDVSRGDTYLGKIVVVVVEPNRAVCKVMPEYRQGTFMEGDHVSSQFN